MRIRFWIVFGTLLAGFAFPATAQRRVEAIVAYLTADTIGCRDPGVMEDVMVLADEDPGALDSLVDDLVAAGRCRPFDRRDGDSVRVRRDASEVFSDRLHVTDEWTGERLDMTTDPPSSVVFSDPLRPNRWWWIPRSAVTYGW